MLFCLRTLLRTTLQKTNRPFYLLHMDLQYVPVCASNLWQWANIDRYIQRENLCLIIAFYWQKPMDRRLGKSEKQCRIYDSDLKCALQPDLWVHQVRCATQVNFSVPLVKWTGVCLCLCQRVVNVPVYCLPVRLCETWVLFVRNTHLLPLYLYCIYYCLWIVEVHLWGQSNALSLLIDDPRSIKIYTLELFKHKCGLFFPLQSKTHCSKEMKGPENIRANTNNGFWPAFVSVLVVGNRRWYLQPIQAAQVVQLLCAVPTIDRADERHSVVTLAAASPGSFTLVTWAQHEPFIPLYSPVQLSSGSQSSSSS